MLLSTFELLLKKITPTPGTVNGSDRSILQGYFLTVANPSNTSLRIRLRFNAQSPAIDRSKLLVIRDTLGPNAFASLSPSNTYTFRLNAGDTGLIILQPDIRTLNPATDEVEVRGFVEISVVSSFVIPGSASSYPLLVTPEHRGTFLPSPGGSGEFDQLISALPTSVGGSLINVETVFEPIIGFPTLPLPRPEILPVTNGSIVVNGGNGVSNGDSSGAQPQLENIQQLLGFMAQRIDELSQQIPDRAEREPVA